MLKRLYVDNYKCLINFALPLEELTLLLGANGAGKSAVFEVMHALRALLSGTVRITDREIFPPSTLPRWQSLPKQSIECELLLDGDSMLYELQIEHELDKKLSRVLVERLTQDGQPLFEFIEGEVTLYRDDHSQGPTFPTDWSESALARVSFRKDNRKLTRFVEHMRRILVCKLNPGSLVTETANDEPMLARNGENFASFYRHLSQERPDLLHEYFQDLRGAIPTFQRIALSKAGQDTSACVAHFNGDSARYDLRLDELSDGQRALIVLYALIRLTHDQGYTLLLDEPDNYLALSEIQPWLLALKDLCGSVIPQAVLTSHHPEIIDYLGAEAGVWLERKGGGATLARRLDLREEEPLTLSERIARGWVE